LGLQGYLSFPLVLFCCISLLVSALPPTSCLSQAAVWVISSLGEVFHLPCTTSAIRLASICRCTSLLDLASNGCLEFRVWVCSTVSSDPLFGHTCSRFGLAVITTLSNGFFYWTSHSPDPALFGVFLQGCSMKLFCNPHSMWCNIIEVSFGDISCFAESQVIELLNLLRRDIACCSPQKSHTPIPKVIAARMIAPMMIALMK